MDRALSFFRKTYPGLRIVEVRHYRNGYFIIATDVPEGEIDINDPYYYVDYNCTIASSFPITSIEELQSILKIKPIPLDTER